MIDAFGQLYSNEYNYYYHHVNLSVVIALLSSADVCITLCAFLAVMAIGFSYHVLFTFPSLLVARAKGLFINIFDKVKRKIV